MENTNKNVILKNDYYKVFDNFDELFDELLNEGLFDGCDHSIERAKHGIGFPEWIIETCDVTEDEIKKCFSEPYFRDYLDKPYCVVPFIGALSKNLNIKPSIWYAYWDCMHPNEYTEYGINGRTRCPQGHLFIHGAFVVRQERNMINCSLNDNCDFYENLTEEMVHNGWIDYAKGFQVGFDTFEADFVDKPKMLSNTLQDKTQRVLDYLSNPLKGGFAEEIGYNKDGRHVFKRYKWYETGIEYGRIYHAWYIVLSNHQLFEAYFENAAANDEQIRQLDNKTENKNTNTSNGGQITVPNDILDDLEAKNLITKEPMQWIGSIRLCAYFVDNYFPMITDKWEKAQNYFNVGNLAQQKDGYMNSKSGKPKGYQIIDDIILKHRQRQKD